MGDAPATVEVQLPADAELWFGSYRPNQTGDSRIFQSPTLIAGQAYSYQVRARWNQDGRLVDQTRTVQVRAGRVARVDFMMADRSEAVPAPRQRPADLPVGENRRPPRLPDQTASPPPDPTPPLPLQHGPDGKPGPPDKRPVQPSQGSTAGHGIPPSPGVRTGPKDSTPPAKGTPPPG